MPERSVEERRVQPEHRDETSDRQGCGGPGEDRSVRPDEVDPVAERKTCHLRGHHRIGFDVLQGEQPQASRRNRSPKPPRRRDARSAVSVEEQGSGSIHDPSLGFLAVGPSATLRP